MSMYYPDTFERQLLHNNTDRIIKPSNRPLINTYNAIAPRNIGGSKNGVSTLKPAKLLYSSSMSGGSNEQKPRKPTVWQTLIKNTMKKGLTMKEAIKYIKDNDLY